MEEGRMQGQKNHGKTMMIDLQKEKFLTFPSTGLVRNASSSILILSSCGVTVTKNHSCLRFFYLMLYQVHSSLRMFLLPRLVSKTLCTVIWRACCLVRLETASTLPAILVEVVDDSAEEHPADLIDGEGSRRGSRGRCGRQAGLAKVESVGCSCEREKQRHVEEVTGHRVDRSTLGKT